MVRLTRACGAHTAVFAAAAFLVLCLTPAHGAEPGADRVIRPKYRLLRHDEDWSGLAGWDRSQTGDLFDPIKYVPLSDDGSIWASFGGHLRTRYEIWNNFGFGGAGPREDTFGLGRVALHADAHMGDYFRFFVEGKSALSTYEDLPGGKRTIDEDTAEVEKMFVDVVVPLEDGLTLTIRPGRQAFAFGRQRLVSPLPWTNTMRRWDGVSVILNVDESWNVHGFWSQFVPVRKYELNEADAQTQFWGLYAAGAVPGHDVGLDLYVLGQHRDDPVAFNGTAGAEERYTPGGRLWGQVGSTGFDYELEGAYQFGRVGMAGVSAFMFATEGGYRFEDVAGRPRVHLGFDHASGDDLAGGDVETFNQLFPLGHAYLGYIDTVGRQNVVALNSGLTVWPVEPLTVRLSGHVFWRADTDDALYNVGGAPIRGGGLSNDRHLGSEIDLTIGYVFNRHLKGEFGYSHFFTGEFVDNTGAHKDVDFVYFSLQFTF